MPQPSSSDIHPQALLLPWLLAGALSTFHRKALAAHLARCAKCRLELTEVVAIRRAVRQCLATDSAPSLESERRVMERLDQLPARAPARTGRH
jgi:anti-sigma factor RsiW